MSTLKNFQEDDLDILISMPYRVGLWMSRVDDIKLSKRDNRREERALEAVLDAIAGMGKKLPFAAAVAAQTTKNRRQWIVWQTRKNFTADLNKALGLVRETQSAETLTEYKKMLFHIASTVAQAFGETGDHHEEALLSEIAAKFSDRFFDPLEKNPENISAPEKAALQKLKEALKG